MSSTIHLVAGDTRPSLIVSISDDSGALDCSGATVTLRWRREQSAMTLREITGTLLTGLTLADGTVDVGVPYNVAGRGGRVQFDWPAGALDVAPGIYEAQVQVAYSGSDRQTVYERLTCVVAPKFTAIPT